MTSVTDLPLVHSVCDALSTLPLTFPDNYQPPPSLIPGKVRVFPIELLPPPEKKETVVAPSGPSLSLNFKSLKPSYSLSLNVSPADSISDLKSRISESNSTASSLRLLLKGKALQDSKLVKDYDIPDGATITIMSKPSASPAAEFTTREGSGLSPSPSAQAVALGGSPGANPRHQRKLSDIPAVVLSPAGSPGQTTPLLAGQTLPLPPNPSYSPTHTQIPLDLNMFSANTTEQTPQQAVFASPEFWEGLYAFLQAQFGGKLDDSNAAFEEFLLSAKNKLTPHEIARIRDRVGVIGMGGN